MLCLLINQLGMGEAVTWSQGRGEASHIALHRHRPLSYLIPLLPPLQLLTSTHRPTSQRESSHRPACLCPARLPTRSTLPTHWPALCTQGELSHTVEQHLHLNVRGSVSKCSAGLRGLVRVSPTLHTPVPAAPLMLFGQQGFKGSGGSQLLHMRSSASHI